MKRLIAAGIAALAVTAAAADARDALVRPGVGIGKVTLGMTERQVRTALGAPLATRRERAGFGVRLVLQYGITAYTVELRGRAGRVRVVSIATGLASERTREGVAVGTTEAKLLQTYRDARCEAPDPVRNPRGTIVDFHPRECVLHTQRGATVFVTKEPLPVDGLITEWDPHKARVLEIAVRAA